MPALKWASGEEARDPGPDARSSPPRLGLQRQRREATTPPSQQDCLEEIKKSNPAFPARRVFLSLQKKCCENILDHVLPPAEEASHTCSPHLSYANPVGEKRRRHNEVGVPGEESKRRRPSGPAERSGGGPSETLSTEAAQGHSRPGRLSRTRRLNRLRRGGGPCDVPRPTRQTEPETSISHGRDADAGVDDVLWTEKYSPRHSGEVVGNSSSVNKVHSWLKKWRRRVDGGDRREEVERKRPQNDDGSWDRGDFQGEAGSEWATVEPLSNALLITGPPGVGKTASVYACALELGFKVFEVNCSSQRSGRCVLAQLKEVTQSHLVEGPGIEALRPAYFNNYNPHSSSSIKPDVLPGKCTSKTTVASTSKRKHLLNPGCSRRRTTPDPRSATLANFFKTKAEEPVSLPPQNLVLGSDLSTRPDEAGQREGKTAAMSLVLFEEVDVIFDDDVGFLSAIRTLMTTTKRPLVLTTSDPSFKERFESDAEEILFKTPSAADVCSYLRLVCLTENARTLRHEVDGLLEECRGDLRRCLLQLQFLVKSGTGRTPRETGRLPGRRVPGGVDRSKDGDENVKCVPPPPDTAYYPASLSGLNTLTKQNILHLLKCQSWAEPDNELLRVLTESWRRRFPLLYSNLELLLPLPASTPGTTRCHPDTEPNTGTRAEQPPPVSHRPSVPKSVSTTTIRTSVRNGSRLSRRKGSSTATGRFGSSPHDTLKPPETGPRGSVDKTGHKGLDPPAHRGLDAVTHFVDLMSYLDSTVATAAPHVSGPCVSKDFFWTGAEVKDGLTDEMREGEGGERTWWQQERLSEIQAAVEGLGFHVYCGRSSAAGGGSPTRSPEAGGAEQEEPTDGQSLPGSTRRLSSGWHLLPQPSAARRRFELSRAVLQNRKFGLLGSRRAFCLDYMSALRSICHHRRLLLQERDGFQNYPHRIHLGLSKATMQLLAEEHMESSGGVI